MRQEPFKHESLLVHEQQHEQLSGREKREAQLAYQEEKRFNRTGMYSQRPYPLQQRYSHNSSDWEILLPTVGQILHN